MPTVLGLGFRWARCRSARAVGHVAARPAIRQQRWAELGRSRAPRARSGDELETGLLSYSKNQSGPIKRTIELAFTLFQSLGNGLHLWLHEE